MSGRRGQMPNFDASFSRRPNNNSQQGLLGEPPSSQSKNPSNFSKNPFGSNNGGGGGNFNDNFSRGDSFGSGGGGGGGNQNFGGGGGGGQGRNNQNQRMSDDFGGGRQGGGGGGGGPGNFQQNRFDGPNNQGDGFGSGWGNRDDGPAQGNRYNNNLGGFDQGNDSPPVPRDRNPAWSTNPNPGMDFDNNAKQQHLLAQQNLFNQEINRFGSGGNSNNPMQGGGMNNMGPMDNQQGNNPVVMVMPQNQGGAGGMMGMMQGNQNPFNVPSVNPMQVILGNLPAFNPAIQQQILQGVGGAFGGGMMPQNMGGIMPGNQQQQPSQQFSNNNRFSDNSGRSNYNNSSDRSRSPRGGNQNRSSSGNNNRSGNRRSDANTNNRVSDGRGQVGGGNNSTPNRDQRKRGAVLRDPQGDEGVDRKRAKNAGNQAQNNKGNNRQNRPNPRPGNATNKTNNKKAGNKQNNKAKKQEEDKKDSEEKKPEEEKDEAKVKTEADGDAEEDGKEKTKEKKVSKYDEFPASLLVCKICQKVMNDGSSFESHLNGRAHLALVKILEQRFQKRTELLMQESKLAEDEIGVEMERQRRAGKNNQSGKNSKNYCKMCDCNYMVNWGTHKVSLGHRILKEFLHPTCRICDAHFVHRADWVAHLITLSHLRKLVELKGEGADMTCHEVATQDELFAITIDTSGDDHITNAITIKPLTTQITIKEDMTAMLKDGKDTLDVPEGDVVIPETYDESVVIGSEAIMTVAGSCCKVCKLYIADPVSEIEPHLKSKTHFNIYVAYLKQVVKDREQKAEEEKRAVEEAEKKAKKEKEDEEKRVAEEAAKAAKAEADKEAAVAKKAEEDKKASEEEKKPELKKEEVSENKAKEEKAEEAMEVEKEEFVVEEEIGGDDEVNGTAEETPVKEEEKKVEKKEEVKPAEKTPVPATPKAQNNQRGRGARGSPGGRGRGQTPNVKATPRVDSNLRGGRGQNSGRSPRGGNQRGGSTPGNNWRGGNRGGRGRPFNR